MNFLHNIFPNGFWPNSFLASGIGDFLSLLKLIILYYLALMAILTLTWIILSFSAASRAFYRKKTKGNCDA